MFQVRVAEGLIDYPTGKSAMIHYETADDVRAAIAAFRARSPAAAAAAWLCRHTIEMTAADRAAATAELHARLLREFTARFGTAPALPGAPGAAPGAAR